MGWVWRVTRSLRLQCLVVLVVCGLALLNLILPHHSASYSRVALGTSSRVGDLRGILSSVRLQEDGKVIELLPDQSSLAKTDANTKSVVLSRLPEDVVMTSPPAVKKELSFGVQEEENSAREVLDADGAEAEKERDVDKVMEEVGKAEGPIEDANAANEIHSGEVDKDKKEREDIELSFHQMPPQQEEAIPEAIASEKIDQIGSDWRNLSNYELDHLSVLGRRLFFGENVGTQQDKTFTILVWKTGKSLERRLLRQYGKEKKDPFRECSVQNCRLTYNDTEAATADAILFHLHRIKGPSVFPERTSTYQRWIFLTDESPYHTFMVAKDKNLQHYNGFFNWSMSYHMSSDIPVPYGRTVRLSEPAKGINTDMFSTKPKGVAIMGSNCGGKNNRWSYVKELQKYLEVDVYGKCGTLKCPGHFTTDCKALTDYKFYLAFENSNCQEYITEKLWWNALAKGAVPVVMGGSVAHYRKLLPPNSFLHIDDFASPRDLAHTIKSLAHDPAAYNKLHAWRQHYRVANEHGYFGTPVFHYCRICEALNYNSGAHKTYHHMEKVLDSKDQCYGPRWEERMKASANTTRTLK